MKTFGCLVVALSGLTLSACVAPMGMALRSSQPLHVGAVEPRAYEPRAKPTASVDNPLRAQDAADAVDPFPRYLASVSVPRSSIAPSPAPTAPRSQARADPPMTGVVAPPATGDVAAMSSEQQQSTGLKKHEEVIRAMDARIVAREREAKRTLSGICTGC